MSPNTRKITENRPVLWATEMFLLWVVREIPSLPVSGEVAPNSVTQFIPNSVTQQITPNSVTQITPNSVTQITPNSVTQITPNSGKRIISFRFSSMSSVVKDSRCGARCMMVRRILHRHRPGHDVET